MLFIWRGRGIFVILSIILACIPMWIVQKMFGININEHITNGSVYFIASAILFFSNKYWIDPSGKNKSRTLIDVNTGETVSYEHKDDFFWIPLRYWVFIMLGLGTLILIFQKG